MDRQQIATRWEKVNVFISSTFNDMHAERDYLVKRVFPELQEWCERRKLRLVDIDLRWGVTEQDATHNKNVVKVCLERIDDCRPFFLCFVGQRRGWVPHEDEISAETFEKFPKLRTHIEGTSITELEILHALYDPLHQGIKRDPEESETQYEKVQHAFFYLRHDSYLEDIPSIPPQLRQTYTNEGIQDPGARAHHDQELTSWRARIASSGCHYSTKWDEQMNTPEIMLPLVCPSADPGNIARWQKQWADAGLAVTGVDIEDDPVLVKQAKEVNEQLCQGRLGDFTCGDRELKEVILEDLKGAISARYPDHIEFEAAGELQSELDQQEEFLYINSEGFIEREGVFADLDNYLNDDSSQLFVLTAPGGMGKTMLLANWIDRCRNQPAVQHTLHFRFAGQSDRSTSASELLRSLMLEIQQIAGKIPDTTTEMVKDPTGIEKEREAPLEIPLDPMGVVSFWKEQLPAIGEAGKTVIVIDAINQLDSELTEHAWIPWLGLPAGIKLVISFREDVRGSHELLESLTGSEKQIRVVRVRPFEDMHDRRALVKAYLEQHLKGIDSKHLNQIITLEGANNPLFLKVVLSELRVFGSFANLADKISSDFGDSPLSAFVGALKRLESDPAHTAISPEQAVPLVFGLLAHARHGLSAEELAGMLRQTLELTESEEDQALTLETTHLFLRQVRPFLARRDGKFDFFYESFKDAALSRYVTGDSAKPKTRQSSRDWHRILANFFEALPLWEDQKKFQTTQHKVAELPYHQSMGELWEEVEKTLCDLRFVEAKCAADQVFELQADYQLTLDRLPERQAEIQEEETRHERIRLWIEQMITHARACSVHRDQRPGEAAEDTPALQLPQAPVSCRMWSDDEIEEEGRRIVENPKRVDKLDAFADFVAAECYPLAKFSRRPGFVQQHALSSAPGGAVHDAAQSLLAASESPVVLRSWPPEAFFNPMPALIRTLEGHTDHVNSVAVSADGQRAVSASSDRTLRVWDVENGKCILILEGHSQSVNSVVLTADGRRAVSAAEDRTLRVWDIESGQCQRILEGPASDAIAVTPDGRSAVSEADGVHVWDLEKGEYLSGSEGHSEVGCVALTPDGKRAVSGGSNNTLQVLDLESGRCLHTLEGHSEWVTSVAVTPDGRRAVSGSFDYDVRVWDLESGQCLHTLEGHYQKVVSVAITPDGRYAVSAGSTDKTLRAWDLETGQCLRTLEGHTQAVWSVAVTPDGRRAVSGGFDATVRTWNLENGVSLGAPEGHCDRVGCLVFTPDGRRVISGDDNLELRIWEVESGRCLRSLVGHLNTITGVAPTPDGRRAVSASWDTNLLVWDLDNGDRLHSLVGHSSPVFAVSVTPDGRHAVSGSFDGTLRIWNLRSGRCLRTLQGHTAEIACVVVTPDGRRAISGGFDGSIRVWNLKNGRCLLVLEGQSAWSVAPTPDGRRMVSGGPDHTLRVWDMKNGRRLHTLRGHADYVWQVAVAPDGRRAFSCASDCTLRVWNLENGRCINTLEGHRGAVHRLALTQDGQRIVSASSDKTVRVWDPVSGRCLNLFAANDEVRSVAGHGSSICVGTRGGAVMFLGVRDAESDQSIQTDTSSIRNKPASRPWWKF